MFVILCLLYNTFMQKNVVITGASSGLGKEIAKIYLQKGNYN